MQTLAVKKDGHYIVPALDVLRLGIDEIPVTIDDSIFKLSQDGSQSDAIKKLESINKELGENLLINAILKGLPKDFLYQSSGLTDKEIAVEERTKKYE